MSKIPGSAHLNLSLGGLIMVGGAMGYIKKRSTASLVAGFGVGSLLIGSSYLIAKTDKQFEAHALATATTGVLALAMGQRYLGGAKFMPAGMVAILGAAGCAYNASKALEWSGSKSD
uniref:Transmembrane protein 14C n=1 Tax=Entomoneis paludosa TaxID=265537 RepID=A0A7S2VBD1_9STRA